MSVKANCFDHHGSSEKSVRGEESVGARRVSGPDGSDIILYAAVPFLLFIKCSMTDVLHWFGMPPSPEPSP